MDISTKGRYGLRALVDMAVFANGGAVTLLTIAERQDLSVKYLEQVFSLLRKAELVRSIKGAQGGYMLAAKPSEMKVGAILRALEGDLAISEEQSNAAKGEADNMKSTMQALLWDKLNAAVTSVLDGVTLQELADDYQKRNAEKVPMYYI